MKLKEILLFSTLSLFLAACGLLDRGSTSPVATPTASPTVLSNAPTRLPQRVQPTAVPQDSTQPIVALQERAEWTLLLYMDADNNLESYGVDDLAELTVGSQDLTQVQIAVQLDRAAEFDDRDGDWTEARRFAVRNGALEQVAQLGEVNMADPATLEAFLAWGMQTYPANKYALVMWGHGVGWQGIAYDESADAARMTPSVLRDAIAAGLRSAEIDRLDLIGFDACLMADFDVLQAVADVADVAVASQELIPAKGWNYEAILRGMRGENVYGDGRWLANTLVEAYSETYGDSFDNLTLSAVDTGRLAALAETVDAMATVLANDAEVYATTISNARGGGVTFAGVFPEQQERYAAIDLGRFASLVAQLAPLEAAQTAAADVLLALDEAVIASTRGREMPLASGIATYFPRFGRFYQPSYADTSAVGSWDAMLTAYHDLSPLPAQVALTSIGDETATNRLNPALLRYYVTGRLIEDIVFWAGIADESGSVRLYEHDRLLPEPVALADGTELRKWRDGYHPDFLAWNATATVLHDGQAESDFVIMWPVAGSDTRFAVQGDYYVAGSQKPIQANLIFDHSTQELVSIWGGSAGSPAELVAQTGDQFVAYNWLLQDGTELVAELGQRFDVSTLHYSWEPLPDAEYTISLMAETASNVETWSSTLITVAGNAEAESIMAESYLDPYLGFQFSYPASWRRPIYGEFGEALLYSSDDVGEQTFQLKLYEDASLSAETVKQSVLNGWDNVTLLFEDDVPIGELRALRSVYGYTASDGERLGMLLTFEQDEIVYALDFDYAIALEDVLLADVERLAASWQVRDVGIGVSAERFATLEPTGIGLDTPISMTVDLLDNGWTRYTSVEDARTFQATRQDDSTGRDAAALALFWLDEAAVETAQFSAEKPRRFVIDSRVWTATSFRYGSADPTQGIMLTAIEATTNEELVVWAEAPETTWYDFELLLFDWVATAFD